MDDPPNVEPLDDGDAAMAAAMGFSSFGAQDPPTKKRRYNPRADASSSSSLPPKPPPPTASSARRRVGTGANRMPLHPRTAAGAVSESAVDAEPGTDGPDAATARHKGGGGRTGRDPGPDPSPRHIDTSGPPDPALSGDEADEGADEATPHLQQPSGQDHRSSTERGGGGSPSYGGGVGGGTGSGDSARRAWWNGYYDPSSNENPWARLELEKGLGPSGSWLAPRGGKAG